MKTQITMALAALLLAGASTTALAQDRGRDRGERDDRGQAQAQPQGAPPAQRGGQPHLERGGPPPGAQPRFDRGGPAQGGPPRFERGGAPQGGPPQDAPPRFIHVPDAGGQHIDRGAGRQWDRQQRGGPAGVAPPVGQRAWDGRRDGRVAGGQFDRRDGHGDGGRGDGGRWDGGRWDGGRGEPQHWQAGRFPAVSWSQRRYRIGAYRAPYGYYARSWGFGEFLPRGWYAEDYWLDDFLDFGLPYPPPGYEWVRVGGDALLVDRFTGRIVEVVRGIFW